MNLRVILEIASPIFFAGVAWAIVQQLRKDLNGLGVRVRNADADNHRRYQRLAQTLGAICSEEKRQWVAEQLRE